MWAFGVVVDPPCFDDPACRGQAAEQVLVQAFIPVLLSNLFWRGQTAAGALWGMVAGLVSSLALICRTPAVFGGVLHFPSGPLQNPALVSVRSGCSPIS